MTDIGAVPSSAIKATAGRSVLAGLAGGLALNLVMLLTFRLIGFGWKGDGFLTDPSIQSAKLIAVWTRIEPLPLVVADPPPIVLGLLLFGVLHAFIYRWMAPAWPRGIAARGLRMAGLIFLMTFLFWEFFTPFNLFGEPVGLILAELVFWAAIALGEGFAMAAVQETARR